MVVILRYQNSVFHTVNVNMNDQSSDQSQYVVCFGAESAMNLLQQRGGMLYNARRFTGRFRGYNRSRAAWRGNHRGNFNWRSSAWRSNRGMNGGRGRGRSFRGNSMMHVNSEMSTVLKSCDGSDHSEQMLIDFQDESSSNHDEVMSLSATQNKIGTEFSSSNITNVNGSANCDETAFGSTSSEFPVLNDLIFLGDSFCKRMVKAVEKSDSDDYKLCKGGLRVNELKKSLNSCNRDRFVGKRVVVFMGMNDVMKGDPDNFNGDAFSLLSKLKEYGVASIFLCTLPIIPGQYMQNIQCFNNAVRSMSGLGGIVSVVECEKSFCHSDGSLNFSFYDKCYKSGQFDFHPNVTGLKVLHGLICAKAFPEINS
ncbi:Jacalin-related lectin 20 [Frankliniella fusca]|uniref:Jacalin-related lectin 20 n=1 Tax=Frankliniella fusca TaxID=407009 RepID=A0AAE1GZE4_9NEOP|nr:Jacalin-related lectin 20 [Frankliniella fusca]